MKLGSAFRYHTVVGSCASSQAGLGAAGSSLGSKRFACRQLSLVVGSDDAAKAWLNGELVHENDLYRPIRAGEDRLEAQLKKGWNELLLKVVQNTGNWGGMCAFQNVGQRFRARSPDEGRPSHPGVRPVEARSGPAGTLHRQKKPLILSRRDGSAVPPLAENTIRCLPNSISSLSRSCSGFLRASSFPLRRVFAFGLSCST